MGEQDNYLRALLGSEAARLQGLGGQLGAQEQAQSQFQSLFAQQEGAYDSALQRMLGMSEQQRLLDQQRMTGQIQAGIMPLDMMMKLATGTTGSVFAPQQAQNPWSNLGAGVAGQALGGLAQGILNPQQPGFLESALGGGWLDNG